MSETFITRDAVEALRKERDTLRQQLYEWENREAAVCPENQSFESVIKSLRQQLIACEAKTEKLRQRGCASYGTKFEGQECHCPVCQIASESPSTALAEYLRPVIHLLEEVAELDSGEQPCIASDAKKVLSTLLTALGKEKG